MQLVTKRIAAITALLFITVTSFSQAELAFNKRFAECEDKWVVFQKGKDSSYAFGYVYIDHVAGLTFNYESNFKLDTESRMVRKSVFDSSMAGYKIRLEPNKGGVALLPASRFDELKIKETPSWLHIYKSYKDTAARLQRWGYYYNHYGMSKKALEYLEPGYQKYPDYKGMAVELAYAYNDLQQWDKAVPVLEKAILAEPEDGYMYKELSYAYFNSGNLEKAEAAAINGIKHYDDNNMKAEIAYNIAYQYYTKKDKTNFSKWATESRKYASKEGQVFKALAYYEEKLK